MADCTCEMPPEMAQAGRAAPLCHHSSEERLRETEASLATLLTYFTHTVSVDDLFDKPMRQVADQYAISIIGSEEEYMNITEAEYHIVTAAFLRQASIAIQALQTSLYLRIVEEAKVQ